MDTFGEGPVVSECELGIIIQSIYSINIINTKFIKELDKFYFIICDESNREDFLIELNRLEITKFYLIENYKYKNLDKFIKDYQTTTELFTNYIIQFNNLEDVLNKDIDFNKFNNIDFSDISNNMHNNMNNDNINKKNIKDLIDNKNIFGRRTVLDE